MFPDDGCLLKQDVRVWYKTKKITLFPASIVKQTTLSSSFWCNEGGTVEEMDLLEISSPRVLVRPVS